MALTEAEIVIVNQSLTRLGSKQIAYATQATVNVNEATQAELHFDQARDSLLRSYEWPFATTRKALDQVNDPPFEWDNKFKMPKDFLRLKANYSIGSSNQVNRRFVIESGYMLTNESDAEIVYIRKVTDPSEFDPLFTEVLILRLAKKMLPALVGTKSPTLIDDINRELADAEMRARTVSFQETNITGRSDWNWARYGGLGIIRGPERYW